MKSEPAEQVALSNRRVVAVDGGTATGKGRLIEELSQLLRLKGVPVVHLSTGSLYRGVTRAGLDEAARRVVGRRALSESELVKRAVLIAREMGPAELMELSKARQVEMHGGVVWLDGAPADVDVHLKGPGIGNAISSVAAHVEVREFVTLLARRQVNEFDGFILMDGRDTTHVIVPDAGLKLLLTVAPEIAAERSQEHTVDEIVARDVADRAHRHGALRHPDSPGDGVIVLPTDDHTPESVRDHVYGLMQKVWPELPPL
jgi:cytidylate kinase